MASKKGMDGKGPQNPIDDAFGPTERRTFLKGAIGTLGVIYAGAVGYPIYRYLASPVEESMMAGAVNEVTLDNAISLPKNAAMFFKFGSRPAMLIHHDDDTWTALSAVCTHLGCTPSYEPAQKIILCPCHGGVYNARTGANISGPPPKPLTEFKVAIANGKITVSRA
ncbi:MAG TPA: Rieske (2Fe-2S) protein [bacterium]|nr:Rieske (2Fe-2S) protein [bacterium]